MVEVRKERLAVEVYWSGVFSRVWSGVFVVWLFGMDGFLWCGCSIVCFLVFFQVCPSASIGFLSYLLFSKKVSMVFSVFYPAFDRLNEVFCVCIFLRFSRVFYDVFLCISRVWRVFVLVFKGRSIFVFVPVYFRRFQGLLCFLALF